MRSLRRKRLRRRHRDSRRARLPVDEVVLRVLGNGVGIGEMNAVQAVDTAVAEIDVDVGGAVSAGHAARAGVGAAPSGATASAGSRVLS